jgi:predicted RNase H-like HicB family nuclease
MSEIIFIVETSEEGGYTAKALGQSIFTEGETLDELKKNVKDAVKCHFDPTQINTAILDTD